MDTVNVKRIGTAVAKVFYASLPTDDTYVTMFSGQKFSFFSHCFSLLKKTYELLVVLVTLQPIQIL
jgi:hypothetical protein